MKTLPITEAHVQQTVKEFLEMDGWRAIRTDPVSDRSRGKGFGEVGMPDYLFIRYEYEDQAAAVKELSSDLGIECPRTETDLRSMAAVFWIEFKRKGAKRAGHQVNWHSIERCRGALCMTVDDIDEFTRWYLASGLNRRIQK